MSETINITPDEAEQAGYDIGQIVAALLAGVYRGAKDYLTNNQPTEQKEWSPLMDKTQIEDCRACWCDSCINIETCKYNPCAGCLNGIMFSPKEDGAICRDYIEAPAPNHG